MTPLVEQVYPGSQECGWCPPCQFLHRIQLQILICLGDLHLRLFGRMSTCVQCRAGVEFTAVNVKSGEHLSEWRRCWRLGRGSGQMRRLDDVKDER